MTGEITLSGKVTPIGGVREKVIAALRAGIRDVVMPADNEKDLEDVPPEVRGQISFHFVRTIDEVLKIALPKHVKAFVPKRSAAEKDEFYEYDDYLFQQVEPESVAEKSAAKKPDVPAAEKPVEKKPAAESPAGEAAKPVKSDAVPVQEKPAEKKPEAPAEKPAEKKPEPPAEKHADPNQASQLAVKKPTLIVNYSKFQNASFTVGKIPLQAPPPHPAPAPVPASPAKSFSPSEKLRLDVKITSEMEPGAVAELPVISLKTPAKTKLVSRKPASRTAKPATRGAVKFRPASSRKLPVKLSTSLPIVPAAPAKTAKKSKPARAGSASAKKGK